MLEVKRTKHRYILFNKMGHCHGSKAYCNRVKMLIEQRKKPTRKDVEYLESKGIHTDLEYIEESILRLVSEHSYNRWGRKQKYPNDSRRCM